MNLVLSISEGIRIVNLALIALRGQAWYTPYQPSDKYLVRIYVDVESFESLQRNDWLGEYQEGYHA